MNGSVTASIVGVRGAEVAVLEVGERRLEVLDHGAHLVGLWVPDRSGNVDNIVVSLRDRAGVPDVAAYRDPLRNPYLGAIVGRFANRIAGSRFVLDGTEHRLAPNEGDNQLHGGPGGFSTRDWDLGVTSDDDGAQVDLRLVSLGGDQGFPGRLEVTARYRLDLDGTLTIAMTATTDAPTVVNLTNHTYWNLSGSGGAGPHQTVAEQRLSIAAAQVVEVDGDLLPTGRLMPVGGTPLDLTDPVRLGDLLESPFFASTGGVDHCWVLDDPVVERPSVTLVDPGSGRRIRVCTDQPGVQLYTANHGAGPMSRHTAVCLETQHLPDSPNQPTFPSPVLYPGQTYHHTHVVTLDVIGPEGAANSGGQP